MRRSLSRTSSALLLASLLALPMTASANPALGSGAAVAEDSGGYLGSGHLTAAEDSGYFGSGHKDGGSILVSGGKDGGHIWVSGGVRAARASAVSVLRTLLLLRLGWM